jgi:hypothetical protein
MFCEHNAEAQVVPGWTIGTILAPPLNHHPVSADIAIGGTGANGQAYVSWLRFDQQNRGTLAFTQVHEQCAGTCSSIGEFADEYKLSDVARTKWVGNGDYYAHIEGGTLAPRSSGHFSPK